MRRIISRSVSSTTTAVTRSGPTTLAQRAISESLRWRCQNEGESFVPGWLSIASSQGP